VLGRALSEPTCTRLRLPGRVELLRLLERMSYNAARKRVERVGATPLSYMRKIYWNLCLAFCDRELCQFIEGRRALVEELYYSRYLEHSAECTRQILPLVDRVLAGEPLGNLLGTHKILKTVTLRYHSLLT